MKKRNFLLVVLLLSSPLTGCLKTSSSEIPHESVLTTEMLRNNAIKEPEIDYGYIESVKEYTALKTASIQSQGFSDQGILVTKNEFNRIGFYSIPLGQQIVHNMFRHESIRDVTVASYQLIAAVIRVYYENMYVFDGYGNLLYNGTNECIVVNEREHEGIIYAQVLVNVREQGGGEVHDEEIYYVYDEFGVASVTDVNIFNYYPNYEPEPIALDDYGLPGYTITYDDEYIVRNASGNEVCRFNMPANTDLMAFFSGKIFYRTKVNVSEGEDYDLIYYNQPIKYTLGTIDLLTGTNTLLNLGYFVDAVYPLRDKDNIFNYCLFTINYVK